MKEIRSPLINMHIFEGIHFKLPDSSIFLYEKYIDEYIDMIDEFGKIAEEQLKDRFLNNRVRRKKRFIYK